MISKKAISIMSELAIHNKRYGKIDKNVDEYYRWDFIYKRNSATRLSVFVGMIILLIFKYLYLITVKNINIFHINYKLEFVDSAILIITVLLIYTLIGAINGYILYTRAENRIREYNQKMEELILEVKSNDTKEGRK